MARMMMKAATPQPCDDGDTRCEFDIAVLRLSARILAAPPRPAQRDTGSRHWLVARSRCHLPSMPDVRLALLTVSRTARYAAFGPAPAVASEWWIAIHGYGHL